MRKHELVIIWETGEKEVHEYESQELAEQAERGYKAAFGNQIQWSGTRPQTEKPLRIFRAYWKEVGKEYKAGHWGYIKARDKEDARRIMQDNLQDGYEVEQITDAYEHQITMQAICVNFPNTAEPLGFG